MKKACGFSFCPKAERRRRPILSRPFPSEDEAAQPPERKGTGAKSQSAIEIYREIIMDNIEYEHLCQHAKGIDRETLDEIADLLVETVCSARKTIRIAGDDYPAELVKAKFLKLDSHHIEFVMDCLRAVSYTHLDVYKSQPPACAGPQARHTAPQGL